MKSIYLLTIFLGVCCTENVQKHKRQIYREQVLPALGGKIPEEAFRTDRLALNRLNKDGIAVIDGILLEARDHEKNPDNVRTKPEIIQVYVTQDSRYVPPEGRYHNERPRSIDTTYVIRSPVGNHDKGEHQRFNGIGNVPAHYNQHNINNNNRNNNNNNNNNNNRNNNNNNINNNNNNNNNCNNNNKNGGYGNGGYRKQLEIPPRGLSPPKAQGYANFYRRLPPPPKYRSGQSQQQQQQHQQYQTIYKPIITPLVIPARDLVITKPYHVIGNNFNDQRNPYQSWDFSYDWNTFYNQQLSEPFLLGDSFDSHQIITDYEGFLNAYHGRSYRHVGASKDDEKRDNLSKDFKDLKTGSSLLTDDRGRSTNIRGEKKESTVSTTISRRSSLAYTDLTRIPETSFTCDGKKGTFADVETKCQVFHECSGWSKTSSLCPAGTAYSPTKKRCEWWNTVTCGSD